MRFFVLSLFVTFFVSTSASAQNKLFDNGLKITFKDDSVRYVKFSILGQFWARSISLNPGTTIDGTPKSHSFDLGLRRLRTSLEARVTPSTVFYIQVGLNNLNSMSGRKIPVFVHDAMIDQELYKKYIRIGGGLHGYNGTTRFSSSAIGSILATDLPLIQETTNDINDQFGRKFGVFLTGEVSKLNYRISVSKPFSMLNNSATYLTQENKANFSSRAPELSLANYFFWQFLDKETVVLPYMRGTYLGSKRILNLGIGSQYQKNAMWYRNSSNDTISTPLFQLGADVFFDYAINTEKKNAFTGYLSYMKYDFGPNYIRNVGVFAVSNGLNGNATFGGTGNGIPMIGTGQVVYGQYGYKFKDDLLGKQGTLQPYFTHLNAKYQALKSTVNVFHVGVNWLIAGQNSKLSLDYQLRPIFKNRVDGVYADPTMRKGQFVLQYQISI